MAAKASSKPISTLAIVGTGVIGAGWAARALSKGLDVRAYDPDPKGEAKLRAAIANAWPALERAGLTPGASQDRLSYVSVRCGVCRRRRFHPGERAGAGRAEARLAGGNRCRRRARSHHRLLDLGPLADAACCTARKRPERLVIGHPFNPVYLLPLVEVIGGEKTSPETITRTKDFYRAIGMRPLHIKREIEGFVADRLMEALWREALWLVNDGIATTEEIDAAVVYGCGLRWSLMGTFLTFHLAGGEGGMRHMLHQFGPALKLPWTKLVAPELTDELIDKVADGCEYQAAGRSIKELERRRDDFLIELLALVKKYWPEAEGRPDHI